MPTQPPSPPHRDSLSVKVGSWFEANATGKGVLAIPLIVLLLAIAAIVRVVLG